MCTAMLKELKERKKFFDTETLLSSIYLGGGTPSVFSVDEIQSLTDAIFDNYSLSPQTLQEATIEANPEDITEKYLSALYQKTPIRRLSIGIQSFREEDLRWMNRKHADIDIAAMIQMCQDRGFDTISIDLIFGLPDMTLEIWEEQLQKAIELNIQHISVYALTVEEKTALAQQVRKKRILLPEDEQFESQFLTAHDVLTQAGFSHYELSNYAKEGYKAIHNAAYWKNEPYLGIGPSAHSFDGKERSWNVANNAKYLQKVAETGLAIENTEIVSLKDAFNEYIMTHLRIASGIDLREIHQLFGATYLSHIDQEIYKSAYKKAFIRTTTHLSLSPQGWLISDRIISDLFVS